MAGWPVWLASISLRDADFDIRPSDTWGAADFDRAEALLNDALSGRGDPARERSFRMCATLCRHRAVSIAEARQLPADWWTTPGQDLAGGPLEVRWERGIPPTLSTQPCAAPRWYYPDPARSDLKVPLDCGECPSCQARLTCAAQPLVRPW